MPSARRIRQRAYQRAEPVPAHLNTTNTLRSFNDLIDRIYERYEVPTPRIASLPITQQTSRMWAERYTTPVRTVTRPAFNHHIGEWIDPGAIFPTREMRFEPTADRWQAFETGRRPSLTMDWPSIDFADAETRYLSLMETQAQARHMRDEYVNFGTLRKEKEMEPYETKAFIAARQNAISVWNKHFPLRIQRPPRSVYDPYHAVPKAEPEPKVGAYKHKDALEQLKHLIGIVKKHRADWNAHEMHESVVYTLKKYGLPNDWHLLALDQPRVAATDATKLAYNSTEDKRKKGHSVITTVGKYLRRHWPKLDDHQIRDIVALTETGMQITKDVKEFIEATNEGPTSCMSGKWGDGKHPYTSYDPKLGWHMGVRRKGGKIVGRVVCLTIDQKTQPLAYVSMGLTEPRNIYVRSYAKPTSESSYSETDQSLEAWLNDKKYVKLRHYPEDVMLLKLQGSAPYLDGSEEVYRRCNPYSHNGVPVWRRANYGQAVLVCTDGRVAGSDEDDENTFTCDYCDENCDVDDQRVVGRDGETYVCESCQENHYREVRGENRRTYWIPNHADYVELDDEYYDHNYLDDNGIICDYEGEYRFERDCCPTDDNEWVDKDEICDADDEDLKAHHWILMSDDGDQTAYQVKDCTWVQRMIGYQWVPNHLTTEYEDELYYDADFVDCEDGESRPNVLCTYDPTQGIWKLKQLPAAPEVAVTEVPETIGEF